MATNDTLKTLLNRKSIRQFTGEKVKKEDLDTIFEASLRCATSINGQQISIVYTDDKDKIEKIGHLCGDQEQVKTANVFVMFVMDFNRTGIATSLAGKKQIVTDGLESIVVGSVDAGIMLATLQTAAHSLGYGTTAIGAVRAQPEAFIDMLNLPKYTFPLVGSTIGVGTKEAMNAPLKPRIPAKNLVFKDKYNSDAVRQGVEEYDKTLRDFRDSHGTATLGSYSESTANYYQNVYFEFANAMKKQGFINKD